jgi:hypothetical protein
VNYPLGRAQTTQQILVPCCYRPRTKRRINLTQTTSPHGKIQPSTRRQWQGPTAITFKPRLYNYYSPLSTFTHGTVDTMPTENEKEAALVRANLAKLRTGGQQQQQGKASFHQPGRGGGRLTRGLGRGGGIGRGLVSSQKKITSLFPKVTTTPSTETITIVTNDKSEQLETNTNSSVHLTVSDLTEHTAGIPSDITTRASKALDAMEEDEEEEEENEEEGMSEISLTATPKTIPKFQPNQQRLKDVEASLPKQRYGIEFKIEPPTGNHHGGDTGISSSAHF